MEERAEAGEDAALLEDLNEERLLSVLQSRYNHRLIYTYIGDILIAVNPLQDLPIYGAQVSADYSSQPIRSLPPHIFAVADHAYSGLQATSSGSSRNQSIVISGDSGAGKTESTKLLLKHLVRRSRGESQLCQQILQVNPLLEAFGNAQTVMNQNSSRFGKYIQLRFSRGSVGGAKISEYLLEKSRVSHQDPGERNFHVFYFLLFGCPAEEREVLGLLQPGMYRYIGHGTGQSDCGFWADGYRALCNAMRMVGFQAQEELDLKTLLAGVLSLGNVLFSVQEGGGVSVDSEAAGWLKVAAGQLGVEEAELRSCLVCTLSVTRGETIRRLHSKLQAEDARDSIGRVIYSRMFGWIVTKVNELLAGEAEPTAEVQEIGILDIFGFENFAVNRFEQLCINLANEQLQNFFNHHIFLMEKQHYLEEGIQQDAVTFTNNQLILDLFLARPSGILSILDEQTSFPQASDASFVEKLCAACKENPSLERGRVREPTFIIHHYAGKVQYLAVGFLEKNRDTIPMNIRSLFMNSVTNLLSLLFSAAISRTGTLMPPHRLKAQLMQETAAARKMSVGAQFRRSLSVLMEKLSSANPHFIRCIKPNREKIPGLFNPEEVLSQLRYNGLLETVRIRRDGYSWRPSFQEFVDRFGFLLLSPQVPATRESCKSILQRVQLSGWLCGSSRLFFKYWHQDELTQQLLRLHRAATDIQKCYKRLRCRRHYHKLLEELRILQEKERARLQELERERARLQELERERARLQELERERARLQELERERARLQELERERARLQELERERARLQELVNEKSSRPVPLPRTRRAQVQVKVRDAPSLPPVPRPRSQLGQLLPFDNAIQRVPSVRSEESERRRIQRRRTLVWFRETQARKVLDDGAFPTWLYGMISRRDTENLLMDRELGDFLIRISQTRAGYILSYRGRDRCRHYMIDVRSNGCYVIMGEDRAHPSLSSLLQHHQTAGIQPYGETLRGACEKTADWLLDCEELRFLSRTLSLGEENVPAHLMDSSDQSNDKNSEMPAHPLPHLHKTIRRAMKEIQQARSGLEPDCETSRVSVT